jgi:hypothetical protein
MSPLTAPRCSVQDKMGSKLSYVHENGINFDRIGSDLIVGSCLQSAADVDTLRTEHSVGTVLCLQEDKDMQWWNLDLQPIVNRASERGDVEHVRMPIRDFDPFSLRTSLPATVKRLCEAQRANGGTAYVHCTAGLGRAPGVALAYMWCVPQLCGALRTCGACLSCVALSHATRGVLRCKSLRIWHFVIENGY